MAKDSKTINVLLQEPLLSKFEDFCVAHYDATQATVARAAIDAFIDDRLGAEPEVKKRFEVATAKRLSGVSAD